MAQIPHTDTSSPLFMTKQEVIQNSSDSHDSQISLFIKTQIQQTPRRIIDKDFLKLSESVMKKVWDNKYDDVWDNT